MPNEKALMIWRAASMTMSRVRELVKNYHIRRLRSKDDMSSRDKREKCQRDAERPEQIVNMSRGWRVKVTAIVRARGLPNRSNEPITKFLPSQQY